MNWENFMVASIQATYIGMTIMLVGFFCFVGGIMYAAAKGL